MAVVIGLLIIAAICGLWYLIRRGTGAIERGLNRGTFDRGEELRSQALVFQAPVSGAAILDSVPRGLGIVASAPAVVGALYVAKRGDDVVLLKWGNIFDDQYAFLLRVAPDGQGARGFLDLTQWRHNTYSKILSGVDSMAAVRARVGGIIEGLGGGCGFLPSTELDRFMLGSAPTPTLASTPPTSQPRQPPTGEVSGGVQLRGPDDTISRSSLAPTAPTAPVSDASRSPLTSPGQCGRCAAALRPGLATCPRCGAALT